MLFARVENAEAIREIGEGELLLVRAANGDKVAVTKIGKTYYAVANLCTHWGCSLAKGTVENGAVTCRCHGSRFRLTNGEVLRGPAKNAVKTYYVTVTEQAVRIEPIEPD